MQFLNQECGQRIIGSLNCADVCMCVSTPRLLITGGMIWTPYDKLNKFYSCYMAIVVIIVDEHGLDMRCGN